MKKITSEDLAKVYQLMEVVPSPKVLTEQEYIKDLENAFFWLQEEFEKLVARNKSGRCPSREIVEIMVEGAKLGVDQMTHIFH